MKRPLRVVVADVVFATFLGGISGWALFEALVRFSGP